MLFYHIFYFKNFCFEHCSGCCVHCLSSSFRTETLLLPEAVSVDSWWLSTESLIEKYPWQQRMSLLKVMPPPWWRVIFKPGQCVYVCVIVVMKAIFSKVRTTLMAIPAPEFFLGSDDVLLWLYHNSTFLSTTSTYFGPRQVWPSRELSPRPPAQKSQTHSHSFPRVSPLRLSVRG